MKKRILLMAIVLLAAIPAAAQITVVNGWAIVKQEDGSGVILSGDWVEQKPVGEAVLECTYDFQYIRDDFFEKKTAKSDIMILQTGNGVSKFFSYLSFRFDSLMRKTPEPGEIYNVIERNKKGVWWVLFKNYPEGKFTLTDKIWRDWYLYEEDAPVIEWEIGEETQEIEGYVCQKAECDFRGRHWTAWFSPEIPVSDGPWKLGGLPGLIMQAADANGEYTFTLNGLRRVDARLMELEERQYLKINRKNYLRLLRKFAEDPIGMMNQSGSEATFVKKDGAPITPSERGREPEHDFLETDYRQ